MADKNTIISKLNQFSDVILALGVVTIVIMMIIPMPPFLLDLLLALNITLSLTIVMISIYNVEPLQFSVFPSLLLVTTLFRLALNVSSTRLILLYGYAGEVIMAFGTSLLAAMPWWGSLYLSSSF
jgi:flagellar biosynthesis protein FlhA